MKLTTTATEDGYLRWEPFKATTAGGALVYRYGYIGTTPKVHICTDLIMSQIYCHEHFGCRMAQCRECQGLVHRDGYLTKKDKDLLEQVLSSHL